MSQSAATDMRCIKSKTSSCFECRIDLTHSALRLLLWPRSCIRKDLRGSLALTQYSLLQLKASLVNSQRSKHWLAQSISGAAQRAEGQDVLLRKLQRRGLELLHLGVAARARSASKYLAGGTRSGGGVLGKDACPSME